MERIFWLVLCVSVLGAECGVPDMSPAGFGLENDVLAVGFGDSGSVKSITWKATGKTFSVDDAWSLDVSLHSRFEPPTPHTLSASVCQMTKASRTSDNTVEVNYDCTGKQGDWPSRHYPGQAPYAYCETPFLVKVTYTLKDSSSAFVAKQIGIRHAYPRSTFYVSRVSTFDNLHLAIGTAPADNVVNVSNPYGGGTFTDIAAMVRFPTEGVGMFVSVMNPFGQYTNGGQGTVSTSYDAGIFHSPRADSPWHEAEGTVLGVYQLSKFYIPENGVNTAERDALLACIDSFMMDGEVRKDATIKHLTGWDVSDYQIDISTTHGQNQYRRIIDRCDEYGVKTIVFAPSDKLTFDRSHVADSWGWEGVLWMTMGGQLRLGQWSPDSDPLPNEVQSLLDYAKSKGIRLLAYVYPVLPFEANPDWLFINADKTLYADLGNVALQDYLIENLSQFLEKTGLGGFAWDYTFLTNLPRYPNIYAPWRGWNRVITTLREKYPEIVMDHRQNAHLYGPWYQLAGTFNEPLAGDENPETYGVAIPSLSAHQVSADFLRVVNYKYKNNQMIPSSRVPGFIYHQIERNLPDGQLTFDDLYLRDFDLMNAEYSLLSTIGTAGLNNGFTGIPARDPEEMSVYSGTDVVEFVSRWLKWTDDNIKYLRQTVPIATLGAPNVDVMDGTASMYNDEGYLFIFNSNQDERNGVISIDEAIGVSNSSSNTDFFVSEIYPREVALDVWSHGKSYTLTVPGCGVRVLELRKAGPTAPILANGKGEVTVDASGVLMVSNVIAEPGASTDFAVLGLSQDDASRIKSIRLGSTQISSKYKIDTSRLGPIVRFPSVIAGGDQFSSHQRVGAVPSPSFTGGNFTVQSFKVPARVFDQLKARDQKYPIKWTEDEKSTPWLVPARLLLYAYVPGTTADLKMTLTVDGKAVDITPGYTSRGRQVDNCYIGFWADLTQVLKPDTPVDLVLHIDSIKAGQFRGLFMQNVETEYVTVDDFQVAA